MRGRKHNTERHNEVPKAHKHGGKVAHHHKGHHADGGEPKKADGNPYVFAEAEGHHEHNIGTIGGEKSKHRADRKHGGHVKHRAHGGAVKHHDEHGMPEMHHGHGGVAKHHTPAGGHHHAHGGKAGADTSPYSSAGRGLRRGGKC